MFPVLFASERNVKNKQYRRQHHEHIDQYQTKHVCLRQKRNIESIQLLSKKLRIGRGKDGSRYQRNLRKLQ